MCQFCDYLNDQAAFARITEQRRPKLHHEYGALLLEISWHELSGRHHYGEMKHRPKPFGFDLNYCPECGRELEQTWKRKRNDSND